MFNPAEIHSVITNGPQAVKLMFHQLESIINYEALTICRFKSKAAALCGENQRTFRNQLERDVPMDKLLITFNRLVIVEILKTIERPKRYIKNMLLQIVIEEALILSYGNKSKASRMIGINRLTLERKLNG